MMETQCLGLSDMILCAFGAFWAMSRAGGGGRGGVPGPARRGFVNLGVCLTLVYGLTKIKRVKAAANRLETCRR